ncbi:hypothetical protein NC653_028507 [Populus alba x Populus x berolinensis]|uniref:Uncharacterized protein n=1 Tax=Populus alba x Populus x berolinensis TaxID=444605 RepID=A0AAD6Q2D8_9ROSI|nr:hypothetical protein NC653_028507 [Populus alba x Populus x berolinensis]
MASLVEAEVDVRLSVRGWRVSGKGPRSRRCEVDFVYKIGMEWREQRKMLRLSMQDLESQSFHLWLGTGKSFLAQLGAIVDLVELKLVPYMFCYLELDLPNLDKDSSLKL